MARIVYTELLYEHAAVGPWEDTVTVPAGVKWVILEYSGALFAPGRPGLELVIAKDDTGGTMLFQRLPAYVTGSVRWRRHQVVNAGESFTITATAGGPDFELDFFICGWQLTLP